MPRPVLIDNMTKKAYKYFIMPWLYEKYVVKMWHREVCCTGYLITAQSTLDIITDVFKESLCWVLYNYFRLCLKWQSSPLIMPESNNVFELFKKDHCLDFVCYFTFYQNKNSINEKRSISRLAKWNFFLCLQ